MLLADLRRATTAIDTALGSDGARSESADSRAESLRAADAFVQLNKTAVYKITKKMFKKLDANGDGKVSKAEFIQALRRNDTGVNQLFGLGSTVRQEDQSRKDFELVYQKIDRDESKSIEWEEFLVAGLQQLSEMM